MTYRTRKRHVLADDGMVNVSVEIRVGVHDNRLTRDEHADITENVASRVMAFLPDVRYLNVPLSKIKVTR